MTSTVSQAHELALITLLKLKPQKCIWGGVGNAGKEPYDGKEPYVVFFVLVQKGIPIKANVLNTFSWFSSFFFDDSFKILV